MGNILSKLGVILLGLGLYSVSGGVLAVADSPWINCSYSMQFDSYYHIRLEVGRNAQEGDVLGTWFPLSNPNAWNCETQGIAAGKTIYMSTAAHASNHTQNRSLNVDGDNYTVYNSGVVTGLGYVARWRHTINGQPSGDWEPLLATGVTYQPSSRPPIQVSSTPGATFRIGMETQIRFVQTAPTIGSNFTGAQDFYPICVAYTQSSPSDGSVLHIEGGAFRCAYLPYSGGPVDSLEIAYVNGTCTTPDVTVMLPEVSRAEFTGPGYTTARKDFELKFNRCPAGWASISYTFTPTTSVVNSSNGVVALDSSSTASGVGIQLLTGNGTPLTYNTPYILNEYNTSAQNASYTVPLTAGLYQTDLTVIPGTANSSVTFTLNYK